MPLIFGTWKLDPKYGKVESINSASEIIDYAFNRGIRYFDTASVYANQEIEKILGKYSKEKVDIISKIPATKKVLYYEKYDALDLYPKEWLEKHVNMSTSNLDRSDYTMLLHNYGFWNNIDKVLYQLYKLKEQGIVSNIGLSLPNNFSNTIPVDILQLIDTLEIPYNNKNKWIEDNYYSIKSKNIVLRSLLNDFQKTDIKKSTIRNVIIDGLKYSDNIIIGMTKLDQIDANVRIYESLKTEERNYVQ